MKLFTPKIYEDAIREAERKKAEEQKNYEDNAQEIFKAMNMYGISATDAMTKFYDINRAYGFYGKNDSRGGQLMSDYITLAHSNVVDFDESQLQNVARLTRYSSRDSMAGVAYMIQQATQNNPALQAEMMNNVISIGNARLGRGLRFNGASDVTAMSQLMKLKGSTLSDMSYFNFADQALSQGGDDFKNAFMFSLYSQSLKNGEVPSMAVLS